PILLTFVTILYRLNSRIQTLITNVSTVAFYWGQITRLEEILTDENKEYFSDEGTSHQSFQHHLVFRNVKMQYKGAKRFALTDFNVKIERGTVVAFVGFSGAGKSTIIDLLIRLYVPTQGTIEVDGRNLETINVQDWRNTLGVVSQDSF